jgi:L-fuculose-phosphate aldolase
MTSQKQKNSQNFSNATQIIDLAKRLSQRFFLAAADGNISCREESGHFLVTPAGRQKVLLQPEDMVKVDLEGKVIGHKKPGVRASSEWAMHATVFRQCSQANWVIHAHPPYATAWTVAFPSHQELPTDCLTEVILSAGRIPIIPYAVPGEKAMGEHLLPFLPHHRIFILARHGALAWGETAEEALNGIERLEHAAYVLSIATQLGGLTFLPKEELDMLKAKRQQWGERIL